MRFALSKFKYHEVRSAYYKYILLLIIFINIGLIVFRIFDGDDESSPSIFSIGLLLFLIFIYFAERSEKHNTD